MISVYLSAELVDLARRWSDAVLAHLTAGGNYTGLEEPDRFYIGYLGELAFREWLESIAAVYTHNVRLDGHAGAPEFEIVGPEGPFTVDTKFASKPTHQRFMYPEAQYQHPDIYVGGRVIGDGLVEVHGWLSRAEAGALPVADFGKGVPTRWCFLGELHDIAILGDKIRTSPRPCNNLT